MEANRRSLTTFTCKGDATMIEGDRKNPGDEDAPGTKQTGEDICPACNGSGQLNQRPCPDCDGSGKVTVIVGDA